jgi:hypothetical protein
MTREQAEQMWPIIKAFGEGKTVQYNSPCGGWENIQEPQFFEAPVSYRINPEYHLRPWKPEEVPVGALIKNRFLRSMILGCDNNGTCYVSHTAANFITGELLNDWEYSLDHGKTWLPCGVEE